MYLSIIIVEYYCICDVLRCIESIIHNVQELDYEIIISCNSKYSREKEKIISMYFPGVTWIFNRRNFGYAKGVNIGLNYSRGNYILIINPDAKLLDKNITQFIKYFGNNPDVGIAGPKIIDRHGNVQDSCRAFITPSMFISRVIKRFYQGIESEILEKGDYNSIKTVDWVSGACMLVRKKSIEKVGLMDERYFLYIEDMDWCKRFWDNGLKVVYWPNMVVQHDATRMSSVGVSKIKFNKGMLFHIISYMKFLMKYSFKNISRNENYENEEKGS